MYKYVSSTKMFHVYTAAPRVVIPTTPKNIRIHRDQLPPTKTPTKEYTQHTPKKNTQRTSTPTSTSAYHHNTPTPALDRDMQKQHTPIKAEGPNPSASCGPQLHSSSTRSPLSVVARPSGHKHPPAQSAEPPPWNPEAPKQTQNIPMVKVPKWS